MALAAILGLCLIVPAGGCRICAECDDLDYPAYGGSWQRTRRDSGRVGSVFDPAGGRASDLVERETPLPPDELARERQADGADPPLFEEDPTDQAPPSEPGDDTQDDTERMRQQRIEDIEVENEDDLRKRTLDSAGILPGQPGQPVL